jgi:hypothetical protein
MISVAFIAGIMNIIYLTTLRISKHSLFFIGPVDLWILFTNFLLMCLRKRPLTWWNEAEHIHRCIDRVRIASLVGGIIVLVTLHHTVFIQIP